MTNHQNTCHQRKYLPINLLIILILPFLAFSLLFFLYIVLFSFPLLYDRRAGLLFSPLQDTARALAGVIAFVREFSDS